MDIEQIYLRIPIISRIYVTGVLLTTIGCQLKLFNYYQLFFSWKLFWNEGQYWRLLTTFLYFGEFGLNTMFHLYFLLQYCQALEEDSFRNRKADFLYFLVVSSGLITIMSIASGLSMEIPFLSASLTFTITYLWARRNQSVRISFLGLFTFTAPFLPWTLIGFSVILHSVIPWADILGFIIGHFYYYFEDVYPTLPESNGNRPLKTPKWLSNLMDERPLEPLEEVDLLNQPQN